MSELTQELKLQFQNYNQAQLDIAFMNACDDGNLSIVKCLLTSPDLKEHADIHTDDDCGLQWACENGHLKIVQYLLTSTELKEHANIHARENLSFEWACQGLCFDIVKYLLSFSGNQYIDFQKTNYDLDWAMENQYSDIVKAMMKSLYRNDMIAYLENIFKVEKYCLEQGLNVQEWQEGILKEDGDINSQTTELFV